MAGQIIAILEPMASKAMIVLAIAEHASNMLPLAALGEEKRRTTPLRGCSRQWRNWISRLCVTCSLRRPRWFVSHESRMS